MTLCCSISKIKQDIGVKFRRYVYSFWHDPRTWKTDRRRNGQTPHDGICRGLCIASRSKKIAIFMYPSLHFLFALGTPLWQSRKTLHKWKDNSVFAKPIAACKHLSSTVSQLFEPQVQTRSSAVAKRPRDASCLYSFNTLEWCGYPMVKKKFEHMFIRFDTIHEREKNRRFHIPQLTFLFPLEMPLRLSRNVLHGWKDNSMLAKPLAAYTYLSSIVSELYDA